MRAASYPRVTRSRSASAWPAHAQLCMDALLVRETRAALSHALREVDRIFSRVSPDVFLHLDADTGVSLVARSDRTATDTK